MEKRKLKKSGSWMENKTLMKILSLLLAVVLWFFVAVTQDPTRTDRVENVEVMCGLSQNQINQGLSIMSKSNDTVSFDATGKRSLVTGVRGNYYAKLTLDDISGPGKYNITPEISRPDGVYVSNVTPSVIEVYVDKYVSSTLPVVIKTKGQLSDNLVITDMTADLSHIDVQLPSLALEQIAYIGAEINLSAITSSTVVNCEPLLLDSEKEVSSLRNVVFDKSNIVVNITVEQIQNMRISPKVSGMEKHAKGFTVTAIPKTIDLCGDKETLEAISMLETVDVLLQNDVHDGQEIEVPLNLPTGTHLRANVENKVKLIFKK